MHGNNKLHRTFGLHASGEPEKHWTKIALADSVDMEVSLTVRKTGLNLSELFEDLIIPALTAMGYAGVEEFLYPAADGELVEEVTS